MTKMLEKSAESWIAAQRAEGRDPLVEALGRAAIFDLVGSSDGAAAWRAIADAIRRENGQASTGTSD